MAVSTSLRKAEQLCLLPPQVGGLWTHALPRSVRLMRTGHQLRCLVALISSLWPTGWFLLWAVTVPESWWMALMSVSGPSESSLTLAEVNREICDCKIQSDSGKHSSSSPQRERHGVLPERQDCVVLILILWLYTLMYTYMCTWVIPAMQCILSSVNYL